MEVGPLVGTGFRGRSGCPHRSAALRPGLTLRGALPGWKAECRPLWSPARAGPTVLGTPPAVSIPPPPTSALAQHSLPNPTPGAGRRLCISCPSSGKCWQSRGSAICLPKPIPATVCGGGRLPWASSAPHSDSLGPGLWAQVPWGRVAIMKEPRSPPDGAANTQAKEPGARDPALPGESWQAGGLAWRAEAKRTA